MQEGWLHTRWFDDAVAHKTVAIVISAGMLIALAALLFFHHQQTVNIVLLSAIVVSAIPLSIETVREMLKMNFSVDILAVISIVTALILHEYWVAALVILMLSGGKAIEEIATRRASSVLTALAKRMPQVAHILNLDGSTKDVSTESIRVGDHVILYPHELCPVDGLVLEGSGGMALCLVGMVPRPPAI